MPRRTIGNAGVGRRARGGFSLLELTLVLVIMGLLMAGAATALLRQGESAKIRTTMNSMSTIKSAITSYMLEKDGSPPTSLSDLVPNYLESDVNDAWKQSFYYSDKPAGNNQQFTLLSKGPDKELGTEDDIDVWTMNQ